MKNVIKFINFIGTKFEKLKKSYIRFEARKRKIFIIELAKRSRVSIEITNCRKHKLIQRRKRINKIIILNNELRIIK